MNNKDTYAFSKIQISVHSKLAGPLKIVFCKTPNALTICYHKKLLSFIYISVHIVTAWKLTKHEKSSEYIFYADHFFNNEYEEAKRISEK